MALKLRTKLLAGFICVALIGSAIGVVGTFGIKTMNDANGYLFAQHTVPLGILVGMSKDFELLRLANLKLNVAVTATTDQKNQIDALEKELVMLTDRYRATLQTQKDRDLAASFDSALKGYENGIAQIIKLSDAGKHDDLMAIADGSAIKIGGRVAEIFKSLIQAGGKAGEVLDSIVKSKIDDAQYLADQNETMTTSMILLMLCITALGLIVSILLALWIGVRMISRPLLGISKTLGGGANQIGAASEQLSSSSQEIANGATEQASSIEETTSSMEELSSMVKQNLVNAKESSTLADKSAQLAQTGSGQMIKMLEAMTEINRSSDEVKKVIKVIDDIAFQTNILALNAAVEAARAGEAGMGFAVVADEVKNLANRSASAAKETAEMIEGSIKKSQGGLEIANRLGDLFQEIVTTGKKVSEMAREVESASRQQDTGIEQVNKAIIQFDEVVQANASSAEETASAAEELQSQVDSLNQIVTQLAKLVMGKVEESEVEGPRQASPTAQRVVTPSVSTRTGTSRVVAKQPLSLPQHAVSRTREISPEQLIPFEDDDDLK